MSFPKICQTSWFMSGLSGSIGLTVLLFTILIWPAIIDMDQKVDAVTEQVALNNVPELKQIIRDEFSDINEKMDKYHELSLKNYQLLCKMSKGDC